MPPQVDDCCGLYATGIDLEGYAAHAAKNIGADILGKRVFQGNELRQESASRQINVGKA